MHVRLKVYDGIYAVISARTVNLWQRGSLPCMDVLGRDAAGKIRSIQNKEGS
jgi:hypothetical protein